MINVDQIPCMCCKRALKKLLRAFDHAPYCSSCYHRRLLSTACARCGRGVRHRVDQTPTYCSRCAHTLLWLNKPCCNCSRLASENGGIYDGRVYCKTCRYLASPDRACSFCNYIGKRVHKAIPRGITQPACPSCRQERSPRCPGCFRNRKLAGIIDGKNVCSECFDSNTLNIISCPSCGQKRPAAVEHRCMGCLAVRLAETLGNKISSTLTRSWSRELFEGFFSDLRDRLPQNNLALLKSNAEGFRILESALGNAEEMTAPAVLKAFYPQPLTRFTGIKEWMMARHGMDFKSDECLQIIHQLKMDAFLETIDTSWIRTLASEFHTALLDGRTKRLGKGVKRARFPMKYSTIRAAVIKAVQFMQHCATLGATSRAGLTEEALDDYTVHHERTWHVLGAFIRYWNRRVVSFQRLELPKSPARRDNPKLVLSEEVRAALVNRWLATQDGVELRNAVVALLMLTYAQPVKRIVGLQFEHLVRERGSLSLDFGKGAVEIDPLIAECLEHWLEQRVHHSAFRAVSASSFLFPGRTARAGVAATTISVWCVAQGITLRHIGASAMSGFFARGMTDPTPLIDILGVTPATAMRYWHRSGAQDATLTYRETFGALRESGQLEKPK